MKNTKIKAILAALLAAMTVAACSNVDAATSSNQPSSSAEATETRDDLVIAIQSEAPTLHPYDHKSVSSTYMNEMTFNTLFIPDMTTLEPTPSLVSSFENLSDTEWQFTIHDGVMFHDGTELTTEDVIASYEYAKTFPTATDYTSFWQSIEAVDDTTFKINTGTPYASTLFDMCQIEVLPSELIAAGHDFNENPIGSGPYIFVSNTLSESVVFKANPNYFDTENAAKIENVTWKIIPEGSSRTISLETGEVDFVVEVESNDLNRLEEDEDVSVIRTNSTRHVALTMDTSAAPFDNVDFRKAISAAVDREAVVTVSLNGEGTASNSHANVNLPGSNEIDSVNFDVEAAKEYLAASGFDTSGEPLEILVNNDTDRRAAEVIQANLAEIGVNSSIVTVDYATFLSEILATEKDYDMAIVGYTSSYMSNLLKGFFTSETNVAAMHDPKMNALVAHSDTLVNPEERIAAQSEIITMYNGMALNVPLYDTTMSRAFDSDLEGVELSPAGRVIINKISWRE